ncbi:hypothetical protein O4G98_07100 [Zoogloeaceae bacterium G21618-S1]|nr:hypothetical protein [Zoogloeaceae bacterium G21618-S1]
MPLQGLIGSAGALSNFDSLALPFRAMATDIVLQAINLALDQNVVQQLAQLGTGDALVQVDLGTIASRDFDRVLDTIPLGEAAAQRAVDALALARAGHPRGGGWWAALRSPDAVAGAWGAEAPASGSCRARDAYR